MKHRYQQLFEVLAALAAATRGTCRQCFFGCEPPSHARHVPRVPALSASRAQATNWQPADGTAPFLRSRVAPIWLLRAPCWLELQPSCPDRRRQQRHAATSQQPRKRSHEVIALHTKFTRQNSERRKRLVAGLELSLGIVEHT